jgi:hypothetical protein
MRPIAAATSDAVMVARGEFGSATEKKSAYPASSLERPGAGEVSVVQASYKCLNDLGHNKSDMNGWVRLGSRCVHRLDS